MARSTTTVSVPSVSPTVFSPKQWATLAEHLARQDVVVLPALSAVLQHSDSDDTHEAQHRRASGLALVQHWASLGFVLAKRDALALCDYDLAVHTWLHQHVTPVLKERLGGHVTMAPMYPNFPKQVMKMDEAELLFNAVLHYAGDLFDLRILPDYETKVRKPLGKKEGVQRALQLAAPEALRDHLVALTQMNTVWTPAQAELAKHALPLMLAWNVVGPTTSLPQRENQAHVVGQWLRLAREGKADVQAWPAQRVSTTDVLRAAVAYSGGDPSLASTAEKVRFERLSRPQRRALVQALEKAVATNPSALEDLHRHRSAWLRLAEQLHVGEWKSFQGAREAIDHLRNQPAPVSWHGEMAVALEHPSSSKNTARLAQLFERNPGFAARALHHVLASQAAEQEALVDAFARVAGQVDTPVLLAVEATFKAEAEHRDRLMIPKGEPRARYRVAGRKQRLPAGVVEQVVNACQTTLKDRFAALAPLGNVYVQPGLDEVIVPKGLRASSDSVGVVTRGSMLPLNNDDTKIVRLFLWWKDTDTGRVDVDLSAVGVDEKFRQTDTCNFQALTNSGMVHSGDIVSAPSGAAEFIDIQLEHLNPRTRYILLAANVFSGPTFSGLPECFVGWQERQHGQRGAIHEVKTVAEKFQVTANTKGFLAAAFDVKERRLMWLDAPLQTASHTSILSNMPAVQATAEEFHLYAASQAKVGHLIDLHVQARGGTLVDDPKDADVVFSVTPRVAKKGQVVIAATQPQAIASTLLQGPVAQSAPTVSVETLEAQEAITPVKSPKVKMRR